MFISSKEKQDLFARVEQLERQVKALMPSPTVNSTKKKRGMSQEARERMSKMMKERHAKNRALKMALKAVA